MAEVDGGRRQAKSVSTEDGIPKAESAMTWTHSLTQVSRKLSKVLSTGLS